MGNKIELSEDEMIEEIDRVLAGGSSDRFTPEQAVKLRERYKKYECKMILEAENERLRGAKTYSVNEVREKISEKYRE